MYVTKNRANKNITIFLEINQNVLEMNQYHYDN